MALQRIRAAQFSNELDVRIFVDFTTDQVLGEFEYVRDEYFPEATIYHAREHIYAPSGCWNILNSLQAGYLSGAELIFLIEEDVLVSQDYFKWSFEAHDANPDCFATCGRLRPEHSSDYYTNPGAAFKSKALRLITPHITNDYFQDQRSYLDARFGEFSEASPLDDGLIRRVIRQQNARVVYPSVPKVAHIGFHFYNKLDRYMNWGTIIERINWLEKFISDVPTKKKEDSRYIKDLEFFGDESLVLRTA